MKLISELPEPYRYLAELRISQLEKQPFNEAYYLDEAFYWTNTLEGYKFWFDVNEEIILPPLKPRYRIKGSVITKMW